MSKQDNLRLANKRFGELLSDGFRLFKSTYSKLFFPFAIFFIISIIIRVFLLTDLVWYASSLTSGIDPDPANLTEADYNSILQSIMISYVLLLCQNLIGGIFSTIAMCSVSGYLYKKYMGQETDFNDDFKDAFNSKMIYPLLILWVRRLL